MCSNTSNGQHEVIELLADLVSIDSVNPDFDINGAGEENIVEFVSSWCEANGLNYQRVGTSRPSVIIESKTTQQDAPTLLLCGHLDTVGTAGMTDPLLPRIEGDRMYGRGTYDMKGGIAAMMIATRNCADIDGVNVMCVLVADEEYASVGMETVLPQLKADFAVFTEPTELEVGIAHRGFVWLEVNVHGIAAHGSRPELGADAIMKSGHILVALDAVDSELRKHKHPLLGPGNLHVGTIRGGQEEATIPDQCTIVLERRTLPGESDEQILNEVSKAVQDAIADIPGITSDVKIVLSRAPFEADSEYLADAIVSSAQTITGKSPKKIGASYWAESALTAPKGISTVLFGPTGEGAHADIEWVSCESVVQLSEILTDTAIQISR